MADPCYLDSSILLEHLLRKQDHRSSLTIEGEWITSGAGEMVCQFFRARYLLSVYQIAHTANEAKVVTGI